jgi:hypothetical protein
MNRKSKSSGGNQTQISAPHRRHSAACVIAADSLTFDRIFNKKMVLKNRVPNHLKLVVPAVCMYFLQADDSAKDGDPDITRVMRCRH